MTPIAVILTVDETGKVLEVAPLNGSQPMRDYVQKLMPQAEFVPLRLDGNRFE